MGAYTDATNALAQSYRDMNQMKIDMWKHQAARQRELDEKTFWRQCYTAALAGGSDNYRARCIADDSLKHHKDMV